MAKVSVPKPDRPWIYLERHIQECTELRCYITENHHWTERKPSGGLSEAWLELFKYANRAWREEQAKEGE